MNYCFQAVTIFGFRNFNGQSHFRSVIKEIHTTAVLISDSREPLVETVHGIAVPMV
jgi:hypothetical protein